MHGAVKRAGKSKGTTIMLLIASQVNIIRNNESFIINVLAEQKMLF